jgi:diacylglycerol kinase family enzyme
MRRMRPFEVDVEMEGERRQFRSIHVTVGNGRQFGGGTPVAPDASLEDGLLDLLSVDPLPPWRLMLLAAAVRTGRHHGVEHLHLIKGAGMHISTGRSLSITADGDRISRTPADFSVLPKAVTVYTGGEDKA